MSAYATKTDLLRLGLSSAALGSLISDPEIDAALAAASRAADGYLGLRFTLPLVSWDDDIRQAVCAIAAYRLMGARGYNPETADGPLFRDNFKDALAWLEKASQGKVKPINVVDSSSAPGNNTDASGNARDVDFVVQPGSDSCSAGGFWENDGVRVTPGSVGASRKRGW